MSLQVEQAELEDRKETDRTGPDDDDVRLDWRAHALFHN
jgi:hypothetical protein